MTVPSALKPRLDAAGRWPTRLAPAPGAFLREIAAPALLVLAALVLHREALLWGLYFYEEDTILFYEPLTRWLAQELAGGHLPLWNPNMFAGYAILADGEVGILYPPQLVALLLLPSDIAMVALRVVHTILAALGAYALARVLGLGSAAGATAGLVWAFGSFNAAQMHHENVVRTAAWLPVILTLAELACRSDGIARRRFLAAAAAALGISALGVHVQPVLLSLLAVGGFVTFRSVVATGAGPFALARAVPGGVWRAGWMLALLIGLGVGLAAVQWLPLFELSRMSFRAGGLEYQFATAFALTPENLIQVVFPYFFRGQDGAWWTLWSWWETHLYVGVPTLALALAGGLLSRRLLAWFFAGLGAFALLVALADRAPLNVHAIVWLVPGLSGLRAPGRYAELAVLACAVLSAFGVDAISRGAAPRVVRGIGQSALGLAVLLALFMTVAHLAASASPEGTLAFARDRYVSIRHERSDLTPEQVAGGLVWSSNPLNPKTALALALLAATGGLFLARARVRNPGHWRVLAAVLVGVDLVLFASDLHPRASLVALRPPPSIEAALARDGGVERILADPAVAATQSNRLVPFGVPDAGGYASLETQRHFDFWNDTAARLDALSGLWSAPTLVIGMPVAGETESRLAMALAVARTRDAGRFVSMGRLPDGEVIRDTAALPRAFVVGTPIFRASRSEPTALERMRAAGFDPRREVVLEEGPTPSAPATKVASFAAASVRRAGTDRLEIQASADAPGYLVISESYHRGWHARVDGQSQPVYLANFLFMAVPLPAGDHLVELEFLPLSLLVGAAVSVVSLVALCALLAGFPRLDWERLLAGRRPALRPRP